MSSVLHSKQDVKSSSAVDHSFAVVVGIDLGTARSGYSFAYVKKPAEIICEQQCGGQSGQTKQLTAVLLRADYSFVAFGDAARKEYLESETSKQHELLYFDKFKMCLYGDDLKTRPVLTAANGKTAPSLEVFSAALAYFKDQSLKRLKESSNGLITLTDVQFVVTVPAVWSPGAKQLMREAAKKAGLFDKIESQLILALESEAASLACRERELTVNAAQWKAGLRYLVYDLGGGTADMTVHKVTDSNSLGEVVASSGGAWGSSYVDAEFVKLLEKIFGEAIVTAYRTANPLDYIEFMQDFETVKHSVTPKDPKPKRLRVPISLMLHVQQQTGQAVEAHVAKHAAELAIKLDGKVDSKVDSKSGKPMPSAGDAKDVKSKPQGTESFLDVKQPLSDAALTPIIPVATSFTASLLSHIVPGYGAPAATTPKPIASATPPSATPQTLTPKESNDKPKKLDGEWVFVGENPPSAPGGIGVSSGNSLLSYSRGHLKLSHQVLMTLFDPIVSKLVAHLNDQLPKIGTISHIFMAGGFCESKIVKAAIDGVIVPRGIKTITPPHAALSVLTGAVIFGLRPKMYGVAVSCEWSAKKHSDRKKSFRPNNTKLVPFCDGIFSPFCLSGDEVKLDYTVSQTYTPGEDNQECMVLKIYQSNNRNVTYIDAPDASLAAQMTLAMADMTGNLQRKVQVTMAFGATEIVVTALDLTSGADCSVKLSFLDRGFEGNVTATASA